MCYLKLTHKVQKMNIMPWHFDFKAKLKIIETWELVTTRGFATFKFHRLVRVLLSSPNKP